MREIQLIIIRAQVREQIKAFVQRAIRFRIGPKSAGGVRAARSLSRSGSA